MKVTLTSFRDAKNWPHCDQYSIARWQPRNMGRTWPTIPELAARDLSGKSLKHLEPDEFRIKYEDRLANKEVDIVLRMLLARHTSDRDIALLCWCNPARQKGYEKLCCHRILVGRWIEEHYPGIQVIYADGAENPVWPKQAGEEETGETDD